jgi:hypothetical protein
MKVKEKGRADFCDVAPWLALPSLKASIVDSLIGPVDQSSALMSNWLAASYKSLLQHLSLQRIDIPEGLVKEILSNISGLKTFM